MYSCYRGAEEPIPDDAPRPLGKPVQITHCVDANLYHDLVSGRSVTGVMDFWNKTVIDTYTKLQSTVETATFGSEFVAGRTASERAIDHRLTARYLGVPIQGTSMMFGDNETVVNASSMPHGKLHKRHNALAFHKMREGIAAKIFRYVHIRGTTNPADILSKHWDMPSVWAMLQPLMFRHWKPRDKESSSKSKDKSSNPNKEDLLNSPSALLLIPSFSRGVTNGRGQPGLNPVPSDVESRELVKHDHSKDAQCPSERGPD